MQQAQNEYSYWCHLCKKEFMVKSLQQSAMQCPICNGEFCELIEDPQNDPRHFVPYGSEQQQQQRQQVNTTRRQIGPNMISITSIRNTIPIRGGFNLFDNLLTTLFPNTNFAPGQTLDQLVEYISRNDPNRYGSPPASQKAIDQLGVIGKPAEPCSVCQDEYTSEAVEMPCKHHFHKECLLPWLTLHNSCPVCRFELPTDDEDYEKSKKQK